MSSNAPKKAWRSPELKTFDSISMAQFNTDPSTNPDGGLGIPPLTQLYAES